MSRIAIISFFVFQSLNGFSQTFFREYPRVGTQWISGLDEKDDLFYSSGVNFSSFTSFDFIKLASNGDTVFWKRFKDPLLNSTCYSGPVCTDSVTILCPFSRINGTKINSFLFLSNTSGDSLGIISTHGNIDAGITWGVQRNKTSIFTGREEDTVTGTSHLFILITDNLGNVIIHKTWQYGSLNTEATKIDTTINNGFIVSGNYTNVSGNTTYPIIVKFDSLGNYQWHTELAYNNAFEAGANVTTLETGEFLCTGSIDLDNDQFIYDYQRYVAKVSSTGGVIWEKDFGMPGTGVYFADGFGYSVQLMNGNLIALGSQVDTTDSLNKIWLSLMDTAGNVQWDRPFTMCLGPIYSGDLHLSNDKENIYLAGTELCSSTVEDMFFLKVDTNGCIVPGCNVGVNEYNNTNPKAIFFEIQPNPANSYVELTYFYANDQDAIIQVRDMSGKIVIEVTSTRNEGKRTILTDQLSNGLYTVSFVILGLNSITKKLVINR